MTRIAVVTGSTRPGRVGATVAAWAAKAAAEHPAVLAGTATVESVDLAAVDLPFLDEPLPAIVGQYRNEHTRRWAELIDGFDGFLFVVPEYNHSFPAPLKNALDYLYAEWNHKAAGFVGYGPNGAQRAVEQLRLVLAELKVATVRDQVMLTKFDDGDLFRGGDWRATDGAVTALHLTLTDTIDWAASLATVRHARRATTPVG